MRGMLQTLFQRAVSSGLYFPLEDIFHNQLTISYPVLQERRKLHNFLAGTMAGMLNGIIMNPAASIKVSFILYSVFSIQISTNTAHSTIIGARRIVAKKTFTRQQRRCSDVAGCDPSLWVLDLS